MRHRKVKNLEPRIEAARHYLVEDAKSNKGRWREFFGAEADSRLYMELGCGKGKFLCSHAAADPDASFIGIEGLDAVMVRGLERANEEQIVNIRFVMDFVNDIREYFDDNELDGIYLNFSDPWPKPRHEKRRSTVLLIAHRIATVMRADHIIVLDGGRIAEEGTHSELMALGGIYRRICELQSGESPAHGASSAPEEAARATAAPEDAAPERAVREKAVPEKAVRERAGQERTVPEAQRKGGRS